MFLKNCSSWLYFPYPTVVLRTANSHISYKEGKNFFDAAVPFKSNVRKVSPFYPLNYIEGICFISKPRKLSSTFTL